MVGIDLPLGISELKRQTSMSCGKQKTFISQENIRVMEY